MSKIKIAITNRWTGSILFEYEKEDNTVKETLLKAIADGANLYGANLYGANLYGANLTRANLYGANLTRANLYGANLTRANLYGANLTRANLDGANLTRANLTRANLDGANLYGASLDGANLDGANLYGASLDGANLDGANLTRANLDGASLDGASLDGANLEPYKRDLFDVLLRAIPEIPALKAAILFGKIDGSTYSGECACLCGTLMKSRDTEIVSCIEGLKDASRPIEKFFANIKPGDTPTTNKYAEFAYAWVLEFESYICRKHL